MASGYRRRVKVIKWGPAPRYGETVVDDKEVFTLAALRSHLKKMRKKYSGPHHEIRVYNEDGWLIYRIHKGKRSR